MIEARHLAVDVAGVGSIFPAPAPEMRALPQELGGESYPAYACAAAPGKDLIVPGKLRRLGRAQQLALGATLLAAPDGALPPDVGERGAVCVGTGLGETGSTAAFLKSVLGPGQRFPRPSHFINSVHNALASEIAMELGFKGENCTVTHGAISFELALRRAMFLLHARRCDAAVACGADEWTPYAVKFGQAHGWWRRSPDPLAPMAEASAQAGALPGEGAAAFLLARPGFVPDPIARIAACAARLGRGEARESARVFLESLIAEAGAQWADIQLVVLGATGDARTDAAYSGVIEECLAAAGGNFAYAVYKHATGEFCTASALGTALAVEAVHTGALPDRLRLLHAAPAERITRALVYHASPSGYHGACLVAS